MMAISMVAPLPPPSQPTSSTFLNSICPVNHLELNNRWKITDFIAETLCFTDPDGVNYKISETAVNVPRTSIVPNVDSNTYVSLSNNIWNKFRACRNIHGEKLDGLIIGANVNGLIPDPFKYVHLNPGCLSTIIDNLGSTPMRPSNSGSSKMSIPGSSSGNMKRLFNSNSATRVDALKTPKSSLQRNTSTFLIKTITCDQFNKKIVNTKRLLVAAHGRVFNVIGINDQNALENVEIPLMRISFQTFFITAKACFTGGVNNHLDVILGFSNGDLIWVNPFAQKYSRLNKNGKFIKSAVISLSWSIDGKYIFVGYGNGEMAIFDRDFEDNETYEPGLESSSKYIKVFKSFSSHNQQAANLAQNPIAHFKFSNKPLTMIRTNPINKNLLVITCDDGFTRLVDYSANKVTDMIPSYFGGSLCSEVSPDGKYLAIGGEDDLISIYELIYVNERLNQNINSTNLASITSNGPIARITSPNGEAGPSSGSSSNSPPVISTIKLITRLKGHNSWIRSIRFIKEKCPPIANLKPRIYKMVSCGDDGKVFFWEFSPKNLPKIKNLRQKVTPNGNSKEPSQRKRNNHHSRSRSGAEESLSSFPSSSQLNGAGVNKSINQLLQSPSANSLTPNGLSSNNPFNYGFSEPRDTVIHSVVSNGLIPMIMPLNVVELGKIYEDGKIHDVYVSNDSIWCFGKNGDSLQWIKE